MFYCMKWSRILHLIVGYKDYDILNGFCILVSLILRQNTSSDNNYKVKTKYSPVGRDANCSELKLHVAFISIHPWANSKLLIDQSLLLCY